MKKTAGWMKTALPMMKQLAMPYLKLILLQIVTCGLVFVFADLIQPVIYDILFDCLQQGNLAAIAGGCIWTGGLVLLMLGIQYVNDVFLDTNLYKAMNAVSIGSASMYHKLPYGKTLELEEGDIYNRISQGGQQLPGIWISLMMVSADFIGAAALLIMCFRISVPFAAVALAFTIVILVRVRIQTAKTQAYAECMTAVKGKVEQSAYSAIHDMEFAVVNNIQDVILSRYEEQRDRLWDIKRQEIRTESTINALYETFDHGIRILAPFLMMGFHGKWGLSYGTVTSAFSVLESLRENVPSLSGRAEDIAREAAPIECLADLLGCKESEDACVHEKEGVDVLVAVRKLTCRREGKSILQNLSFDISSGQKVAVIGKNGCGKSTLLRAIMGLYEPDAGCVLVKGANAAALSQEERRSLFAYAPAKSQLFSESVIENVLMGADCWEEAGAAAAAKKACVQEDWFDKGGSELSGGQAQRTNIARAFIHRAPLFVLDEPASSVDERQTGLIFREIMEMENTVIAVTHDRKHLECFDRILVMEDGKIVADGTLEQVQESEAFRDWAGRRETFIGTL